MTKIFNSTFSFLFVIGVLFVLIGGYIFLKSEKVKSWPTTTGIIISSETVKTTENRTNKFYSDVTYEYFVGSTGYKGNKVGIGSITNESFAKEVTRKYPPGKNVMVFYNIKDPTEALLEVGAAPIIYYFLGIGIVFILVSSAMIYFKKEMLEHFEKMMIFLYKK